MGENLDEDSEYKFTLFSDIHKNVLAMHEQLNEEVPESLFDEFEDPNISTKFNDIISDEDEDDDDDVSLSERQKNLTSSNESRPKNTMKRTLRTRSCAKKSPKNSSQEKSVAAKDIVDTIEISDNEVECIEPGRDRVSDSLSIFNLSSNFDSSVDEMVINDEDDNKLVSVKINWMNLRVHRFEIRKFQKFTTVFKELAEKEGVPKEKILLILRDTVFISEDDSPDSLKLSIIDIIEGGVTKEVCKNKYKRDDCTTIDENMLELKCVLKDIKKPLRIVIKKTDSMQRFMVKASEQLERPLEKLKFMFEGEPLESSATPIDLDMEGGEVIHVHVKD